MTSEVDREASPDSSQALPEMMVLIEPLTDILVWLCTLTSLLLMASAAINHFRGRSVTGQMVAALVFLAVPLVGFAVLIPLLSDQDPQSTYAAEPAQAPSDPLDPSWLSVALPALAGLLAVGLGGWGIIVLVRQALARRRQRAALQSEHEAAWYQVRESHRRGILTVASYETDFDLAFSYPAFNDPTSPSVQKMIRAMKRARDVADRTESGAPSGGSDSLLAEYRAAVEDFTDRLSWAENAAKSIALSALDPDERKDMEQAQKLLAQAQDPGNPEAYRETLYGHLKIVVDRLNARRGYAIVPGGITYAIGSATRLALPSGS